MKIGILGGGQLGRMFIQNAIKYNDELYTLDPSEDSPCAMISHFVRGDFNNYYDVLSFGKDKDIVTIEIEHVNTDALFELEKKGVKVIPNAEIISIFQQKIKQKEFYKQYKIPSSYFQIIKGVSDKIEIPFPFVQKLNVGGYDGKGVQVIKTSNDLVKLWDNPSVIETLVDIEKELSIIIAKSESGDVKVFPVTEMIANSELNLLDFNICPANISEEVQRQIEQIVQKFISAVNSAGLFAIELFLDKEGTVLVNETAPRLHNSGHQTQEGNINSQFEQMYRVIRNLPLADVDALGMSGMLNLIGEEGYQGKVIYEGIEEIMKISQAYIHLYGKRQTKPGRKMGHINVLAENRENLIRKLTDIKSKIKVIA